MKLVEKLNACMSGKNRTKKILLFSVLFIVICVVCTLVLRENRVEEGKKELSIGQKYLNDMNYDQAVVSFSKAISISSANVSAYEGRPKTYVDMDQSGKSEADTLALAEKDYEKIIKLDKTLSGGYLGLADVYIRENDLDKAEVILEQGEKNVKNNEEIVSKINSIKNGDIIDTSGRYHKRIYFDSNQKISWYVVYTYRHGKDESGTSFDANGNQTSHIEAKYDEKGRIISTWSEIIADERLGNITYEYKDDDKNPYREIFYNTAGTKESETEIIKRNSHGSILQEKRTQYVSNGQIQGIFYTEYQYDKKNRPLEEIDSDANGYECKMIYKYDDQKHTCTVMNYDSNGKLHDYEIISYDDNGNEISSITYNPDGSVEAGISSN